MVQFELLGITYRTNKDATKIEGCDGGKWNVTYSLRVRAFALDILEAMTSEAK